MATELKRMTFVVTPEMEPLLDGFKKDFFYNRTQSDMIRTLVEAGLEALATEKKEKNELQKRNV
ncbi:hypothetical protein Ana3638_00405 [Anaerocolumna sedimenticola]|uniref:CopG family transcriptional regulator n=1 Tax=Anaerocolumna sedimenticola TaxID=2696063 RepID=A0A6P1THN5_9FIRM|nr:hypothetical protein [Anaerocolumna sedimenticola]QHQ59446.1 hypothetical protein Ana3638_00405 [Anaerocolumna sedimenticola]